MVKGDIVLITFPFTDLTGTKLRPAVILSEADLDLTVCFITAQTQRQESTDILVSSSALNGLKVTSLIRTSKIATLDRSLVKGLLGRLTNVEIDKLNENLKRIFLLS